MTELAAPTTASAITTPAAGGAEKRGWLATAGLLLRGGQGEFTAQATYDWLARSASAS